MSATIAVIGANGFIGSRIVESFHLRDVGEVRPIVRSVNGLARLSRFDLDARIADARDEAAMTLALQGCDWAIHAVAGDPATIVGSVAPAYRAAQSAGVKRIVYLSSASVHGQSPLPGTDENTRLQKQPLAYNNAKIAAERKLFKLRATGKVEAVALRPGIVTGPRSFWISNFVAGLCDGSAYLIAGGAGICNSIYVDNLVDGIHLACTVPAADGEAFLLGDAERVTWSDLYRPIAAAMGADWQALPNLEYRRRSPGFLERMGALQGTPFAAYLLAKVPKRFRRALDVALTSGAASSPWAHPRLSGIRPAPVVSMEMALLYGCNHKLPHEKAARILGYQPRIPFEESCRRTLSWLQFAGYS